MAEEILVIKKSGEREAFSEEKVLRSMRRVGLPRDYEQLVLDHIKKRLHPGITTAEIFSHITEFLHDRAHEASIKYSLKQAIFDLGPTGFPFEKFVSRIFEHHGYKTHVDLTMQGECVTHEIDVLLEKNGTREVVEAKFHNQQGIKTDIHVAMYTYARFLDVKDRNNLQGVWIATNTKLSEDAIVYATCKKMGVVAWNYPEHDNLQELIETPHLYPITILHDLNQEEKQQLLTNNIVLCSDLLAAPDDELRGKYYINTDRLARAKESARMICGKS